MTTWPVYGKIDGPIVMIGFGSIGKGTLPLIERHFGYDKKRLVVIDQDGSGPGDGNQMSILAVLKAPRVNVLGITIVTGNAWRDEEDDDANRGGDEALRPAALRRLRTQGQ